MGDDTNEEEFEPLFDYSRVQPVGIVCLDDDDSVEESTVFVPKKRKRSDALEGKKEGAVNAEDVTVIDCDDKEEKEEDWLPPPPKIVDNHSKAINEDSTLKALRLKRQELESFAMSADEMVRAVEESVRKDLSASSQHSPQSAAKKPAEPVQERKKIVISIQDKDGVKQFRVFADDKFERLFKMYAERNKLDAGKLVFVFDGDKVNPSATPISLEMDDEDIIEVHVK